MLSESAIIGYFWEHWNVFQNCSKQENMENYELIISLFPRRGAKNIKD